MFVSRRAWPPALQPVELDGGTGLSAARVAARRGGAPAARRDLHQPLAGASYLAPQSRRRGSSLSPIASTSCSRRCWGRGSGAVAFPQAGGFGGLDEARLLDDHSRLRLPRRGGLDNPRGRSLSPFCRCASAPAGSRCRLRNSSIAVTSRSYRRFAAVLGRALLVRGMLGCRPSTRPVPLRSSGAGCWPGAGGASIFAAPHRRGSAISPIRNG